MIGFSMQLYYSLFQASCFDSIKTEGSFFFINWHKFIIPICINAFTDFQYMVAINILKGGQHGSCAKGQVA